MQVLQTLGFAPQGPPRQADRYNCDTTEIHGLTIGLPSGLGESMEECRRKTHTCCPHCGKTTLGSEPPRRTHHGFKGQKLAAAWSPAVIGRLWLRDRSIRPVLKHFETRQPQIHGEAHETVHFGLTHAGQSSQMAGREPKREPKPIIASLEGGLIPDIIELYDCRLLEVFPLPWCRLDFERLPSNDCTWRQ